MRINHNIAALNTYRALTTNNANGNKSLEKLSSGMRINRAGDDAAGLAISEKMRGQIRGLDQASRNAQDGISMIQTAEGALNETHSILQRMRELADQSANDTNVDVDREEIQKEINQLTSEINRIGNTTEFNTQKLLNGGGEVEDLKVNTMKAGAAGGVFKGGNKLTAVSGEAAVWDSGTVSAFAADKADKSGAFVFNGVKINLSASNGATKAETVDVSGKKVDVILDSDGGIDDSATATAIIGALNAYKNAGGAELADFTFSGDENGIIITGDVEDGDKNNAARITKSGDLTVANVADNSVDTAGVTEITEGSSSIPITKGTNSKAAVAASWASGDLDALTNGKSGSITFAAVTIDISGKDNGSQGITEANQVGAKLAINTAATASNTAAEQAQLIVDAFNAVKAEQSSTGSLANFTFKVEGNGIKITGTKEDGAKNNDFKLTSTEDVKSGSAVLNKAATDGVTEVRGEYSFEIDTAFEKEGASLNIAGQTFTAVASDAESSKGQFNLGTDKEQQAISLAAAINANSSLKGRFDAIVDGSKITLREKTMKATGADLSNGLVVGPTNDSIQGKYSFNVDESVNVGGRYTIGDVNIEVTDDVNNEGLANGTAVLYSADKTQQATNLANAIAANDTLSENYDVEASSNRITLTQKAGKESMEAIEAQTGSNKNENFEASFQVGANSGQSMTIGVKDMRANALNISGDGSEKTVIAKNGKVASYVQVANVTDGTNKDNVEFALDVSSHDKASAAISVINDAIEAVSAQRSQLGAFQNRLDHTINNLGTSSENLTAAESRVRDVDMAQEMMTHTKNNILAQAAQSMLAQANQQPQNVLQLLR